MACKRRILFISWMNRKILNEIGKWTSFGLWMGQGKVVDGTFLWLIRGLGKISMVHLFWLKLTYSYQEILQDCLFKLGDKINSNLPWIVHSIITSTSPALKFRPALSHPKKKHLLKLKKEVKNNKIIKSIFMQIIAHRVIKIYGFLPHTTFRTHLWLRWNGQKFLSFLFSRTMIKNRNSLKERRKSFLLLLFFVIENLCLFRIFFFFLYLLQRIFFRQSENCS